MGVDNTLCSSFLMCYSHRFMRDSLVQEVGTHESLLARGGEYANVYTLQARAFLPDTENAE